MFKSIKFVLKERDFLCLFLAEIISVFGDVLFFTAITWFIFSQSNSSSAVGLLKVVDLLPTLLFIFVFGVFTDRKHSRVIFRVIYGVQGAVVLALIWTFFTGTATIPVILICIFVNALVASGKAPLVNKLLVKINRDNLSEMNTLLSFGKSSVMIAGSLLAGILTDHIQLIILIDFFTFVVAFFLISRISVEVDGKAIENKSFSLKMEIGETVRYLRQNPNLCSIIGIFVFIIVAGTSCALSLPVVSENMGLGNNGFGLLKSFFSGGGLLIIFLMPLMKRFQNKLHWLIVFSGLLMVVYGLDGNIVLRLGLLLFIGLFSMMTDILFTTLVQKIVDEKILGKLFSLITSIAILANMAGNILYGFLFDAFSTGFVMFFSGGVFVVCGMMLRKCFIFFDSKQKI